MYYMYIQTLKIYMAIYSEGSYVTLETRAEHSHVIMMLLAK